MNYQNYIESHEWQKKRMAFLRSRHPKCCYVCSTPYALGFHLHHLTYENLGREPLSDLVMVCPPYHELIHFVYDKQGSEPIKSLKEVTEYLRKAVISRMEPYEVKRAKKRATEKKYRTQRRRKFYGVYL